MSNRNRNNKKSKKFTRSLTVVGATGVALLSTTPAMAQPSTAWDEIIRCESGGSNIMNSGGSTAGGYFQITNGTWAANGGTEFAPTAIQATFEQQATVAQRIAVNRGSLDDWIASQDCWAGKITNEVPDGPAGSALLPAPVTEIAPAPVAESAPVVQNTYTVQAGDTLGKIGATTGVDWHSIAETNGIASPFVIYPGQVLTMPGQEYTVAPGDTLSKIGKTFNVPWQDIYENNAATIGPNPDMIFPGQVYFIGGLRIAQPPATVVEVATVASSAPQALDTAIIINSFGPVSARTQAAANVLWTYVPGVQLLTIGGTRASAIDPHGHPSGNALDYMVLSDTSLGNAIVQYHIDHWADLGVEYIIYQQKILLSPDGSWKMMEDRGSPTANHYDHVHVNYNP